MKEANNNRENHVDRATSSISNGYSTMEDVIKIAKTCIKILSNITGTALEMQQLF
jgi:hypothetical protein